MIVRTGRITTGILFVVLLITPAAYAEQGQRAERAETGAASAERDPESVVDPAFPRVAKNQQRGLEVRSNTDYQCDYPPCETDEWTYGACNCSRTCGSYNCQLANACYACQQTTGSPCSNCTGPSNCGC